MDSKCHIARFREVAGSMQVQTVEEHCANVAKEAEGNCTLEFFKPLCRLAGLLHDAGKFWPDFDEMIRGEMNGAERKTRVQHSIVGAMFLMEKLLGANPTQNQRLTAEILRHVILSHHVRLSDCVDPQSCEITYLRQVENKQKAMEKLALPEEKYQALLEFVPLEELRRLFDQCVESVSQLRTQIPKGSEPTEKSPYGPSTFYLGMVLRLVLSFLMDADRTDAARFEGAKLEQKAEAPNWALLRERFMRYLKSKQDSAPEGEINTCRGEISQYCADAAEAADVGGIYRLAVPTGAGKTLSSLRFALNHALKTGKRRIFYVAPFNSILEQNADDIRHAVNEPDGAGEDAVLEHHCNVILEEEKDENDRESDESRNSLSKSRYRLLTENWRNVPIIATTAVQFLETLFSHRGNSVRRLQALTDAVIVLDEVQAIPTKCLSLFNMAMNFLTRFCRTTVVLCTATQPPLDELEVRRLVEAVDIIPPEALARYFQAFKRANVEEMEQPGQGWTADELAQAVLEKLATVTETQNALVVVNTRPFAREVYERLAERLKVLKEQNPDAPEYSLYHLSTNLCPAHREEVIQTIRAKLAQRERLICVSTQLIEAGVDISFRVVFRSLAGLDSIVQAAGRCNRSCEYSTGEVFIVRQKEHDLPSISEVQEITRGLLRAFRGAPQDFGGDLLSVRAMERYYNRYFKRLQNVANALDYPTPPKTLGTTLVDLLSFHGHAKNQLKLRPVERLDGFQPVFRQAFARAGEYFQVIDDDSVAILVNFGDGAALIDQLRQDPMNFQLVRQAQRYSVSVRKRVLDELLRNGRVQTLESGLFVQASSALYDLALGLRSDSKMELMHY